MNDLGQAIVERLIAASIGGAVALSIALAATLTLKRLSPTVLCWIWRLAVIKLLVSFVWLTPVEIHVLRGISPAQVPPPVVRVVPSSRKVSTPTATSSPSIEEAAPAPVLTASTVVAGVWMLGLLVMVAGAFVGSVRSRRFVRSCERVQNKQAASLLQACRTSAGVRRTPALLSSAEAISPVLVGMRRPTIVVPAMLLEQGRESELRLALAHELSHIKRLDPCWTYLYSACRALLFFHPLIWLSNRPWSLTQEAACDAETLTWSGISPATYADSLVSLARTAVARTTGLAVVPVYSQKDMIKRRLAWIESCKPISRRARACLALGLTLFGVFGIVPWRLAPVASAATHALAKQDNAPQAIGEIDWLTPTLAPGSSAESGGFRVLKIERHRDDKDAQFEYNGGTISLSIPALTTAVWIEIPKADRTPPRGKYDDPNKDVSATVSAQGMRAMTGIYISGYGSRHGGGEEGSVICVYLPLGYPDTVKALNVQMNYKGRKAASWTFTNLPKTPMAISSDTRIVTDEVVQGIKIHAIAERDFALGDRGIFFGIQSKSVPKGEKWDVTYGSAKLDHMATVLSGSTPGISMELGLYPHYLPNSVEPAFIENTSKLGFHVDLKRYATHDESITIGGLSIEPARRAKLFFDDEVHFHIINRSRRSFATPSGLVVTIPVQNGGTPCQDGVSGHGEHLFLKLTSRLDNFMSGFLPNSPLSKKYGLPVSMSIDEAGYGSIGAFGWKDGQIDVQLDVKKMKSGPIPPIKLTFTQRVDIESVPLDFVVPVVDRTSTQKPAKQAN